MTRRTTLRDAVVTAACTWVITPRQDNADDLRRAVTDYRAMLEEIDRAVTPSNGTDTSDLSAMAAAPAVGTIRRRIVDAIRVRCRFSPLNVDGLTCDELENALARAHQAVSPRVNELVAGGWLEDSGLRRRTRTGRAATVWTLSEQAMRRMASPEWIERKETLR